MYSLSLRYTKPSKEEQLLAMKSYASLVSTLENINSESADIEIVETKEVIQVPLSALKLLSGILKELSQGNPISVVPVATEVTTQAAADFLGCSRPHIIKLLEGGEIPFTKVGKHRRIKFEDVIQYKKQLKEKQKKALIEIMSSDEANSLYDL